MLPKNRCSTPSAAVSASSSSGFSWVQTDSHHPAVEGAVHLIGLLPQRGRLHQHPPAVGLAALAQQISLLLEGLDRDGQAAGGHPQPRGEGGHRVLLLLLPVAGRLDDMHLGDRQIFERALEQLLLLKAHHVVKNLDEELVELGAGIRHPTALPSFFILKFKGIEPSAV